MSKEGYTGECDILQDEGIIMIKNLCCLQGVERKKKIRKQYGREDK